MAVSVQTHTTTNYKFISNRSWANKLQDQYKFSPIAYVLFDLMQKIFSSRNVFVRQFKDGDLVITTLVPFACSLNMIVHSAGNIAGRYEWQLMEWEHYVLVPVIMPSLCGGVREARAERPACCGVKSRRQGWLQRFFFYNFRGTFLAGFRLWRCWVWTEQRLWRVVLAPQSSYNVFEIAYTCTFL